MEASKVARAHQAHKKEPQSQDRHMSRRAYAELSDPTDQDVRNREVENNPEHGDGRRRKSLTSSIEKVALCPPINENLNSLVLRSERESVSSLPLDFKVTFPKRLMSASTAFESSTFPFSNH
jgi:hypothetical protein